MSLIELENVAIAKSSLRLPCAIKAAKLLKHIIQLVKVRKVLTSA